MHTKLTLRLDDELIRSAKVYSAQAGKSLSQIVADYFAHLTAPPERKRESLPPRVRALRGALRGAGVDEEDYRRHLEEKHR